jgi:hypothetical protein
MILMMKNDYLPLIGWTVLCRRRASVLVPAVVLRVFPLVLSASKFLEGTPYLQ